MNPDWLAYAQIVLSVPVMIGSVCRLDLMRPDRNRILPRYMYLLMGTFACGVLIDAFVRYEHDWYDTAGLLAILIHMWISRRAWKHGPPPDTERGALN